jgi:hypothetical protein
MGTCWLEAAATAALMSPCVLLPSQINSMRCIESLSIDASPSWIAAAESVPVPAPRTARASSERRSLGIASIYGRSLKLISPILSPGLRDAA